MMKQTESLYSCSVTRTHVWRVCVYEAAGGIGSASQTAELVAERCSEERHCSYLARCPMRQGSCAG